MVWKISLKELPVYEGGEGVRCLALCEEDRDSRPWDSRKWVGYVDVMYHPQFGWRRSEDEEHVRVREWITIDELAIFKEREE